MQQCQLVLHTACKVIGLLGTDKTLFSKAAILVVMIIFMRGPGMKTERHHNHWEVVGNYDFLESLAITVKGVHLSSNGRNKIMLAVQFV